jgi:hypothetical protein
VDTWRLAAGSILMLALLAGEIYIAHEVISLASNLLG